MKHGEVLLRTSMDSEATAPKPSKACCRDVNLYPRGRPYPPAESTRNQEKRQHNLWLNLLVSCYNRDIYVKLTSFLEAAIEHHTSLSKGLLREYVYIGIINRRGNRICSLIERD